MDTASRPLARTGGLVVSKHKNQEFVIAIVLRHRRGQALRLRTYCDLWTSFAYRSTNA